jgi:hypothetical protein
LTYPIVVFYPLEQLSITEMKNLDTVHAGSYIVSLLALLSP